MTGLRWIRIGTPIINSTTVSEEVPPCVRHSQQVGLFKYDGQVECTGHLNYPTQPAAKANLC